MSDSAANSEATDTEDGTMATTSEQHLWLDSVSDDVDWHATTEPKPLFDLLDGALERFPDNTCTSFLGRKLSYREISAAVDRTAAGLQKLGVSKGTHVGLFFPNCPSYITYYYAVLKLGATVVNFNPLYTVEELEYQTKDSGTTLMVSLNLSILFDKVEALLESGCLERAIICDFPKLLPRVKSALYRVAKRKDLSDIDGSPARNKITTDKTVRDNDGQYEAAEIDPRNDVAVLQYTGGTTGVPKGAMLTHQNLYVNTLQIVSWAPQLTDGKQSVMAILPFFHVFGMTCVMNFAISRASEIVLIPKFELEDALKVISKAKPTCMPGVPTLYTAIINHDKLEKFDLSSLKFCFSGGAPLPMEIKNRFEELTLCKLIEGYGLSESSPVIAASPLEGPVKDRTIGIPMPGTLVSLRDLEDPSLEVPLGERGEICVTGPQVMKGYWGRPEETDLSFVGDYLRTGDVATMDPQGFIYIVDRVKDIILCSGFNVYPRAIEDAAYQHSAVEEVTVVAVSDDYRGEAPKAFIKLHQGKQLTEDDLLKFLKTKLSKIEMPRDIEFRDELPKTLVGKLSKKELQAEEADRQAAVETQLPKPPVPPV